MKKNIITDLLRISMGWLMLWPFFDKIIGLGYKTCSVVDPVTKAKTITYMCAKAVIKGGSATEGFLKFSAGPLKDLFQTMAAMHSVTDILFLAGLLAIGVCFILGIGMRIASFSGALMMILMYFAAFVPETNPIIDDHIIYAFVFLFFGTAMPEQMLGLGNKWANSNLVKKLPFLH